MIIILMTSLITMMLMRMMMMMIWLWRRRWWRRLLSLLLWWSSSSLCTFHNYFYGQYRYIHSLVMPECSSRHLYWREMTGGYFPVVISTHVRDNHLRLFLDISSWPLVHGGMSLTLFKFSGMGSETLQKEFFTSLDNVISQYLTFFSPKNMHACISHQRYLGVGCS